MTATAHALIGGIIAASIQNPAIGLPLATISHPFVDMIPHWDFGWGWRTKTKFTLFFQASADLLCGIILCLWLFPNVDKTYLLTSILFSESWDILQTPYWLLGWKFPPFSWCYNFQHHIQGKAKLPWGILTQAITVIIIAIVLKVF